jgi:hypothetical protein
MKERPPDPEEITDKPIPGLPHDNGSDGSEDLSGLTDSGEKASTTTKNTQYFVDKARSSFLSFECNGFHFEELKNIGNDIWMDSDGIHTSLILGNEEDCQRIHQNLWFRMEDNFVVRVDDKMNFVSFCRVLPQPESNEEHERKPSPLPKEDPPSLSSDPESPPFPTTSKVSRAIPKMRWKKFLLLKTFPKTK